MPDNRKPKPTYLSLFSGIGGLDEGLHRAGFRPVFCSEIDRHAAKSLQHWCRLKRVSPIIERDINQVRPHTLKRKLCVKVGDIDLLAGGPPCQSFSLIGNRKSLGDSRGELIHKMIEFARVFKPKAVLIEQVKGLISAPDLSGTRGAVLTGLLHQLEGLGYHTSYKVLRAADYGVPQLRDRVFIVGIQGRSGFKFPERTHAPQKTLDSEVGLLVDGLFPYTTVRDAIADLPPPVAKGCEPEVPSHIDVTPDRDKDRIAGVPEGQCLAKQLHLPAELRQRLNPKKDTTKFRRLSWDAPSLTLRGGEAFYHPQANRYLTPREFLRIHGFRDSHILFGPIRSRSGKVKDLDQHRLVANAVPPPLAEAIGRAVIEFLGSGQPKASRSKEGSRLPA